MIKGLNTDVSPILQPEETYRYALNAVNKTIEGDVGFLSKEMSAEGVTELPVDYTPIGSIYIGNGDTLIFSVRNKSSEIGILSSGDTYNTLINTSVLGFSIKSPISSTFRSRKNGERTVYFVDSINKPRCINIDKLSDYYSKDFYDWLQSGKSESDYTDEKWDVDKFDLIKSYNTIPNFESVEILETGNIKPGSYMFGIMYLDEDMNNTNVITTSNPVIIYNDNLEKEYNLIRGSRNIDSALMSFGTTNKAIKLTLSNFDESYPFYKIVIIQCNAMTGIATTAFVSDVISTNESIYVYSGEDEKLSSISLAEIAIDKDDISNVEFITQLENRLILGKYKTKNIDYSSFQKNASKIRSHLTTKRVYLNSVKSFGNPKNPKSTFDNVGYMPGEVYSFGICYVLKDGTISPVYHIPGRNKSDIRESINGFNDNMDYHETPDSKYPEIHECLYKDNYWGTDNYGDHLVGRAKRHHKFPTRKNRNLPLYDKLDENVNLYKYVLKAKVTLKEGKTYPVSSITNEPIVITTKFNYRKENSYSNSEYVTTITDSVLKEDLTISIYSNEYPLEKINGSYSFLAGEVLKYLDVFHIGFTYEKELIEVLNPAYYTDIFGIRFDNIEKPHPDVVGYFIVRNERLDSDRIVVDNAIVGPVTAYDKDEVKYRVFNKWVNVASGEEVNGSTRTLDANGLYFFNEEYQYKGKTLDFDHIDVQGFFETSKITSYNNGEPPSSGDYNKRDYGVVLADVAEGTSYNPDVHADKDSDGFNLLIGYRNSNVKYTSLKDGDVNWSYDSHGDSTIDNILYIGAANSKFYDGKTYYNATQDNKIGFVVLSDEMFKSDSERKVLFGDTHTKLYYASLTKNNQTSYTNFIDRDYFKEHNNVASFDETGYGEPINIFNGDAYVNPSSLVAMSYYGMEMADRKKKDKKCSGILGVALIVVGVVATVFTAGAAIGVFGAISAAASTALTAVGMIALSAGASMYKSYMKLESLKKMINEDYPKGLQDAIIDKDMSDHPSNEYPFGCGLKDGTKNSDDAIIWFADRLTDLFLESSINSSLRTSLTSVSTDFINPLSSGGDSAFTLMSGTTVNMIGFDEEEFRSYLVEKLTTIAEGGKTSSSSYSIEDSDKTVYEGTVSGRVYKGFPNTEWYDVNPDFEVKNTSKVFIHLPINYDSCKKEDYSTKYENRILYSQESYQEEQTDNYRVFLTNNYKDMEGEYGPITNIFRLDSNLFIHTTEGLWFVPKTVQEKVNDEMTTYIGTGEFLSIPPQKLDGGFTSYGSQSKFGTVLTKDGVFFVNQTTKKIFFLDRNKSVAEISSIGMNRWFQENLGLTIGNQLYQLAQYKWRLNNPTVGSGIYAAYDPVLDRILITKKDYKFTDSVKFTGEYDNNKLNYSNGDIFIGSNDNSTGRFEDNIFYLVESSNYLNKRSIIPSNFIINSNVTISDVEIVAEESFENVTGYWYNKNEYTFEEIDYGNVNSMVTITNGIEFNYANKTVPSSLRSEYINAYFEFDFRPKETKLYVFDISSSGTTKLYIDGIEITNGKASLVANQVYSFKIDFIHESGEVYLKAQVLPQTYYNGSLKKIEKGIIEYTPASNYESVAGSEDYFYVVTDKTPNKTVKERINISVKDREGEEKSFPFFHTVNQTNTEGIVYSTDSDVVSVQLSNFYEKYKRILVFPVSQDGTIKFINSINVPHKITITYNDIQKFTIDNSNVWNTQLSNEYDFRVKYDGITNSFTVLVEVDWSNPEDNNSYVKNIFYTIDYEI